MQSILTAAKFLIKEKCMESAKGFTELVLHAGLYDFENGDEPTEAIALVESRDAAILREATERAREYLKTNNAYDGLFAAIMADK